MKKSDGDYVPLRSLLPGVFIELTSEGAKFPFRTAKWKDYKYFKIERKKYPAALIYLLKEGEKPGWLTQSIPIVDERAIERARGFIKNFLKEIK